MRKLPPEEIGVLKLPPKLRKLPPEELGQHKLPINSVVAAAASTGYSLAYGQDGTALSETQIDLNGSDALATSGSHDVADSEKC
jgi:hypothetical protein